MSIELLIQAINACLNGACQFVTTMQANPVGAFYLLTVMSLGVLAVWLLSRRQNDDPKPRLPKRSSNNKRPSSRRERR